MQDRPTAGELLEAVREFVQKVPELPEGLRRYHSRVAANVLAIVERELASEPAATRAEWGRMCVLLGRDDPTPAEDQLRTAVRATHRELATRIRAGDFDGRFDELLEVLRESVGAKLRVANPNY